MEYFTTYESIIGLIYLTSDGTYLTGLFFNKSYDALKHKEQLIQKDLEIFNETKKWLDIYFTGKDPNFEIKFRFVGPIFKGNTGFFNHTEAYACGMKIDNVLIPKAKAKRILNCMGIDWVFN